MPRKSPFPNLAPDVQCPHCSHKVKHLGKHIKKYHPDKYKAQWPRNEEKSGNSEPFPQPETPSQADAFLTPEIKELENTVLESEKTYNPEIQTEANSSSVSNSEELKDQETLLDPQTVQYITVVLFKTVARVTNEPTWELDKDEAKILMPPLTKVLNKYAPTMLKNYQDEVVLAATFGSIMLAKIQLIRAQKKTQEVNTNARRNDTPTPTGNAGLGGGISPKPEPLPKQAD